MGDKSVKVPLTGLEPMDVVSGPEGHLGSWIPFGSESHHGNRVAI